MKRGLAYTLVATTALTLGGCGVTQSYSIGDRVYNVRFQSKKAVEGAQVSMFNLGGPDVSSPEFMTEGYFHAINSDIIDGRNWFNKDGKFFYLSNEEVNNMIEASGMSAHEAAIKELGIADELRRVKAGREGINR